MAKAPAKKVKSVNDLNAAHLVEDEGVVITPKGRGMFVALAKQFLKKGDDPSKAKYAVELLIPAGRDLDALYAMAQATADDEGWKAIDFRKGQLKPGGKGKPIRSPFINAEDLEFDGLTSKGEPVDLEDCIVIRCNSMQRKPIVRDMQGNELDADEIAEEAYSGRWMRLMVKSYGYDNESKGVAFGLEGVQLLANDDKYGRGGSGSDGKAFGAVDDEDEDDEDEV